jgi:DNA-nicking Smr family endonuclease
LISSIWILSMSERHPTPEEKKLWRESNRFTKARRAAAIEKEPVPATPAKQKPIAASIPSAKKPAAATPLSALSAREAKRHADKPQATLDLHGYSRIEAHVAVHDFLAAQIHSGRRHVAIITGKGRKDGEGVLRRELPHWLNGKSLRPLISGFFYAPERAGGMGVLHVLLKKA